MKQVKENIDDFDSLFLPFKYNDAIIFSKSYKNRFGFFGVRRNTLFFEPRDSILQEFEIEVPENIEELTEFIQIVDFIIQKIAMNKGIKVQGDIQGDIQGDTNEPTMDELLRPFINFMRDYEKGIHLVEGLKNGIL